MGIICRTVESDVSSIDARKCVHLSSVGCHCGVLGQSIRRKLVLGFVVVMGTFTVSLASNSSHITLCLG